LAGGRIFPQPVNLAGKVRHHLVRVVADSKLAQREPMICFIL
jgi:hypothetical protein